MSAHTLRAAPAKVFVRGLEVQAEVGLYAHEHGRRQLLVFDVELTLSASGFLHIGDTVNYEKVREQAKALAESGHWKLVETFAEKLAELLMEDLRVSRVVVRVEKPSALKPDAAAAGVEITLERL